MLDIMVAIFDLWREENNDIMSDPVDELFVP